MILKTLYNTAVMLQKLNFKPGFNKQATDSGVKVNGWMVILLDLDMDYLKK